MDLAEIANELGFVSGGLMSILSHCFRGPSRFLDCECASGEECAGEAFLYLRLNPVESSGLGVDWGFSKQYWDCLPSIQNKRANLQPGSTCIEILCDFALFSQNMRAALVLGFSVLPRDVAVIHSPGIPREDNHREFQY